MERRSMSLAQTGPCRPMRSLAAKLTSDVSSISAILFFFLRFFFFFNQKRILFFSFFFFSCLLFVYNQSSSVHQWT